MDGLGESLFWNRGGHNSTPPNAREIRGSGLVICHSCDSLSTRLFGASQRGHTGLHRFCGRREKSVGPWEKLMNQIFLGSDEFVKGPQRSLDSDASKQEIPAAQRPPNH